MTTHNKEEMPFCIRFVDSENNVREEFISFVPLVRTTGEAMASKILTLLRDLGIPLQNMRGQCYDGAASMSGAVSGVQARILREAPLVVYTHCSNHALNLVITHSCRLPDVRNMIDKLKETCMFFNNSPKRSLVEKRHTNKSLTVLNGRHLQICAKQDGLSATKHTNTSINRMFTFFTLLR